MFHTVYVRLQVCRRTRCILKCSNLELVVSAQGNSGNPVARRPVVAGVVLVRGRGLVGEWLRRPGRPGEPPCAVQRRRRRGWRQRQRRRSQRRPSAPLLRRWEDSSRRTTASEISYRLAKNLQEGSFPRHHAAMLATRKYRICALKNLFLHKNIFCRKLHGFHIAWCLKLKLRFKLAFQGVSTGVPVEFPGRVRAYDWDRKSCRIMGNFYFDEFMLAIPFTWRRSARSSLFYISITNINFEKKRTEIQLQHDLWTQVNIVGK